MAFSEDKPAPQFSRAPHYMIPICAIGVLAGYWPDSTEKIVGLYLLAGVLAAALLRDADAEGRQPVWSLAYYSLVAAATLVLLDPVLTWFGVGPWDVVAAATRKIGFG